MKKRYGILASAALVGALCLCALPCAGKGEADASPQSLYAGRTQDADVLIDIPNLRQYGGYTCGTTCVQPTQMTQCPSARYVSASLGSWVLYPSAPHA